MSFPLLSCRHRFALLALGVLAVASVTPPRVQAIDFSVQASEEMTGPARKGLVYRLKLGGKTWQYLLPDGYRSTGGGELRIFSDKEPQASIVWQESTSTARAPLDKPDPKTDSKRASVPPSNPQSVEADKNVLAEREAIFRRLLPPQAENVRLVNQAEEPVPVNGLHNYELTFAYQLLGTNFQQGFMVNRASEHDFFTAVTVAPAERYNQVHNVLLQTLSTATVSDTPDAPRGGPTVRRMGGMGS